MKSDLYLVSRALQAPFFMAVEAICAPSSLLTKQAKAYTHLRLHNPLTHLLCGLCGVR